MYSIPYKAYKTRRLSKLHEMIDTSACIWNHCIALQRRYYSIYGGYIHQHKMKKHIAKLRNKNEKWQNVKAETMQEIIERVDMSYSRFFKKIAKRPPKFKKREQFTSFTIKSLHKSIVGNTIRIRNAGVYKFTKHREYENIKRVIVKRNKLGEIYFVFVCEMVQRKFERLGSANIGLDFGLKTFLTCSNGERIVSPEFYKTDIKKIKLANRAVSRKQHNSNNRKRAIMDLARVHKKITDKRRNYEWNLAHYLCKKYSFIAIEDLNIAAMKKIWGRKISDLSFSSFVERLEEVARKYGTIIQKVGRYYPSSRTCTCGEINKDLKLSDRQWTCEKCGAQHDRDLLASNNILSEGIRLYDTKHKTDFSSLGLTVQFHN